ncbi:hypothetical protein ES708_01716 [subsurface metagenome]
MFKPEYMENMSLSNLNNYPKIIILSLHHIHQTTKGKSYKQNHILKEPI